MNLHLIDPLQIDPDDDVWVEACVVCEADDNHGNAYCRSCDH